MAAPVTYQLTIQVEKPVTVVVGRLGEFIFPAGGYVYTGSAKRNIEARIARHRRKENARRWHTDYLLAAPGVLVVAVKRTGLQECVLNQKAGGQIAVSGFGASDCRR